MLIIENHSAVKELCSEFKVQYSDDIAVSIDAQKKPFSGSNSFVFKFFNKVEQYYIKEEQRDLYMTNLTIY